MDSKIINAICMGATVTVIAAGVSIIEEERNRIYIPREPRINTIAQREFYIDNILNRGDRHCVEQIRMKPIVLYRLCDVLTSRNLLRLTQNVSIREQVIVFLQIIGQNQRFRVISGIYYRSVETIHRYFRIDCVGAIDGTHVPANVPFIYVLAGWEGSAHDSRVLADALSRSNGFKISEGKYYLGDAGYGIQKGIISPFRGVRYHLNEFTECAPENEKELFNFRHSSLRTVIERGFGILKSRFRSIDGKSFWSYETQVDVVLACCIIHNHIMEVDHYDFLIEEICPDSEPIRRTIYFSQREEREENREWIAKREMIASTMWNDYNTQRNL
ncbi:nuclease HARBI [Salix suchowensis]|nr:nuclease HARBI [Salix suchowensis]